MVEFHFIISKEEDIHNWLKFINNPISKYGVDWLKSYPENFKKKVIGKSKDTQIKEIIKYSNKYYTQKYLDQFFKNKIKLNKYKNIIVERLEKIHNRKFPLNIISFKYNTFIACPYQYRKNQNWFGIFVSKKYIKKGAIGVTIHELMHLFFHYYFWDICKSEGLGEDETHFIKESFSVIINKEFKDILDHEDYGYPNHMKLRKFIENEWNKNKSFEDILKYVASNFNKLK